MKIRKVFYIIGIFVALFGSQSFSASLWAHAERTFIDAFDPAGLAILAVGTAATVIAFNNDQAMKDAWVNNQRMPGNFSAVGDYYGQGYVEIGVAVGQLLFDTQNGIVTTEGLSESFVILEGLKYGVGRTRPDNSDNLSFPSGHTTFSFAFASSMAAEYPWYIYVPAFAMGAYTGLSRLADNKHWLSDVVAGATLGTMFGRAGYKHHFGISPLVINDGGDGFGLLAKWQF
jgi:hypothetical protein